MDIHKAGLFVLSVISVLLLILSGNIESSANNVTPAPTITDLFETDVSVSCYHSETKAEEINTQSEITKMLPSDDDNAIQETNFKPNTNKVGKDTIIDIIIPTQNKTTAAYEVFPQNITRNMQTIYDWKLVFLKKPKASLCQKNEIPIAEDRPNVNDTITEENKQDPVPPVDDIFESFEEWKKNKLVEAKTKKSEEVSQELDETRPTLRKQHKLVNYASQDCGAKILDHNKEAKHVSAILDENKDLYMLNPCSNDIWFVIELCEPIQVQTIHLSNLELFSSSPNEFSIFVSERYPAREWKLLDKFTAKNQRNLQVFHHESDNQMFAKYIKFQMLSHFGNEHFCPITMVRVFGISMVEVYESHENEKEDEDLQKEQQDTEQEEGTFDAMINIVKTAIGIDRATKKDEIKIHEEKNTMSVSNENNDSLATENDSLLWESPVQLVENVTSESLIVLVKTGNGEMVEFYNIPICSNGFINHISPIAKSVNNHMCWFIEFVCKISLASCLLPANVNGTEFSSMAEYFNFKNTQQNSTYSSHITKQQILVKPVEQKFVNAPKVDSNIVQGKDIEVSTEASENNKQIAEPVSDNSPAHDKDDDIAEINPPSINGSSKVNESITIEQLDANKTAQTSTLNKNHSSLEPLVINPGSNQKESVFMRLSNRIRILEQNMTLSSDYLENLSQRYKKQVDELQKAFNSTVNKLIETSKTADENDKKQTELIHLAEKELQQLSNELNDLAKTGEVLNRHLIERHLLLIIIEIVVFISLLYVFIKKNDRKVKHHIVDVELKMKEFEKMLKKSEELRKNEVNEVSQNIKNSAKKKTLKKQKKIGAFHVNANNVPETLFSDNMCNCPTNAANFKQGDFCYESNPVLISDQTKEWAECNDKLHKSRK